MLRKHDEYVKPLRERHGNGETDKSQTMTSEESERNQETISDEESPSAIIQRTTANCGKH